jgi:hypothetical protein
MFALGAVICFVLAAFGASSHDVNFVYLGLAFWAADYVYPIRPTFLRR